MSVSRKYTIPPQSKMTLNVNSYIGSDKDVSIQLASSKPIVSERPVYSN